MPTYVDAAIHPFGRYIMCHLWSDTPAELFAMVDRIGVQRKWLQCEPKASWTHFDISKSKRALAVQYGAIECDQFQPLIHCAHLDIMSGDPELILFGIRRMSMALNARQRRSGTFIDDDIPF